MFVVEATNPKRWRWIAGIFEQRGSADAFLNAIPDALANEYVLVELPHIAYPFLIVEDEGFEYGGLEFVRERLSRLVPKQDEDFIHLNVYVVREDFVPEEPGVDSMGSLFHWHITDRTLREPRSRVFAQELAEFTGDA
jgi:hypothetical protein